MKFIVAVSFMAFAIFGSVQAEIPPEMIESCKEKTNCKEDILNIIKSNEQAKTSECLCAMGCLAKAKGIVTDSGLDQDKFKDALKKMNLPEDKLDSMVGNCKVSTTDECEIAKTLYACIKT